MALFWTKQMVVGPLNERPDANDPRLSATVENEALYLSTDDGSLSRSDGSYWWPVEIGGASLPGVTPDGQDPPGIGISGRLTIGDNTFTVGPDGEAVTADDILAPTGQVKGQTLGFYPLLTTGAPSTGAHTAGEMVMDSAGAIFACTVSGTPGTWGQLTIA